MRRIAFTAWDPSTSQMESSDTAAYLYDSQGRLRATWDPRINPALKTRYVYDSEGHVVTLTPPGLSPWSFTYTSTSQDPNPGRLLSMSRPGIPSGSAQTTFAYNIPITGSGAPIDMGPTDIAAWGQTDLPTEATAIFPPGHVPAANPPTDFEWASLHYFNASGQQVNVAAQNASGDYSIGTTEYDEFGNVVRSLTPSARDYAIANGVTAGEALAIAQVVDTRLVFADDGIELLDVYGPQHQLQLDDGSIVDGRLHKHITYDEGAPSGSGGPFHLATTVTDGVLVEGETVDTDLGVSTTTYDWDLLEPVTQTTDPGGLELVTRVEYDPSYRRPDQFVHAWKPERRRRGTRSTTSTSRVTHRARTALAITHPSGLGCSAGSSLLRNRSRERLFRSSNTHMTCGVTQPRSTSRPPEPPRPERGTIPTTMRGGVSSVSVSGDGAAMPQHRVRL